MSILNNPKGISLLEKYIHALIVQFEKSDVDENNLEAVDAWFAARLGVERQIKPWP